MLFRSHQLGRTGEVIAARHLEKKGYTIIERSWRSEHLELDLVAIKGDFLIIVEVKTRSKQQHADPDDTIGRKKLRALFDAAEQYIERNKIVLEVRYDLITIIHHGDTHTIEHLEEAFYPFMQ